MTTRTPAPKRLVASGVQLERFKDRSVKIIDPQSGSIRLVIPAEDWEAVAFFFSRITEEGALL